MSQNKDIKARFVASIMQFLSEELSSKELSDDAKESIEVSVQCLETAFNINPVDGTLPSKKPLLEIFTSYLANSKEESSEQAKTVISDEDKAKADMFKNEGNELMKNGKYQEALEQYTKAIEVDNTNPIYYCNRAAAQSKLSKHAEALEDCRMAIKHDPNYSKAYCRMGLAYVNLGDHQRARDAYKKAVELDPSESNQSNLALAEEKLQEQQAQFSTGFNMANVLNNPNLMNMASQLMSNPNIQNMFTNIMSNYCQQSADPNSSEGQQTTGPNLENLMQASQQIFAQNPELVEQMKNTFSGFKKNDEGDNDKNPN